MMSCLDNDILRETWKSHPLYCKHNKNQLVDLCRQNQIPIPYGYDLKHNLVKLIAEKSGSPTPPVAILYSGSMFPLPHRKLSAYREMSGHGSPSLIRGLRNHDIFP